MNCKNLTRAYLYLFNLFFAYFFGICTEYFFYQSRALSNSLEAYVSGGISVNQLSAFSERIVTADIPRLSPTGKSLIEKSPLPTWGRIYGARILKRVSVQFVERQTGTNDSVQPINLV